MLVAIDDLTRHNYSYLTSDDECYYLCEYFSRMGYDHSPDNQLIFNFKKPVKLKGTAGYHYKAKAIDEISSMFRNDVLTALNVNHVTLVPIPPSKTKTHQHYDDRILQMLSLATKGTSFDYRELISQKTDTQAAHDSDDRPRPEHLKENYLIESSLVKGSRDLIVLVDDVLTTGAHYVACRDLIKEAFPEKKVIGIFIARCNRNKNILMDFNEI